MTYAIKFFFRRKSLLRLVDEKNYGGGSRLLLETVRIIFLWTRLRESTRPLDQPPCGDSQRSLYSAHQGHSKLGPPSCCTGIR